MSRKKIPGPSRICPRIPFAEIRLPVGAAGPQQVSRLGLAMRMDAGPWRGGRWMLTFCQEYFGGNADFGRPWGDFSVRFRSSELRPSALVFPCPIPVPGTFFMEPPAHRCLDPGVPGYSPPSRRSDLVANVESRVAPCLAGSTFAVADAVPWVRCAQSAISAEQPIFCLLLGSQGGVRGRSRNGGYFLIMRSFASCPSHGLLSPGGGHYRRPCGPRIPVKSSQMTSAPSTTSESQESHGWASIQTRPPFTKSQVLPFRCHCYGFFWGILGDSAVWR